MAEKKDLAQLIRDNPGAVFFVDNDCWSMHPPQPKHEDNMTEGDWDNWQGARLATDGDVRPLGDGRYGSGNCYGGDILQALAAIVGVKIESV